MPAATPPTVTTIASGYGPIYGGVALGPDGVIYFTSARAGTQKAKIVAINPDDTVKWVWEAPSATDSYNMLAVPAIDAAGLRLYIGNDLGELYCLNTVNGAQVWKYQVPTGTDKRIRSGAALDPERPGAPSVYFHCNNGRLYALNAQTGAVLWNVVTGNIGAPVDIGNNHTKPVSSSPVVDRDGVIYVGTAKAGNAGSLLALNRSNGSALWEIPLTGPVEASPAIGAHPVIGGKDWIYIGTRRVGSVGGYLYGIDPTSPAQVKWWEDVSWLTPGLITSPVIDRNFIVYQADFHDTIWRFFPWTGVEGGNWVGWDDGIAKHCQPPVLTDDGLMILGTSKGSHPDSVRSIRAYDITQPNGGLAAIWNVTHVDGQPVGDFVGSAAVRANSHTAYIADINGKVYRFNAGSTLMKESPWPTFQCGSRRAGKKDTIGGYQLVELPVYYYATQPPTVDRVNIFSVAVGQAHGHPAYPYSMLYGFNAAKWTRGTLSGSWGYYFKIGSHATGINSAGDAVGFHDDGFYIRPLFWGATVYSSPEYLTLPQGFTPTFSFASDIAADGTIIGHGRQGSSTNIIRWTKSGSSYEPENLGSPAGNQAFANAYSDAKRIAGKAVFTQGGQLQAYVTGADAQSFLTVAGLGTFGGAQSEAMEVHDISGTVGWAHDTNGRRRAFHVPISASSIQSGHQLPRLEGTSSTTYNSEAYSINRYGWVVGTIQNDSGQYRAFVRRPGELTLDNLNNWTLASGETPGDLGWVLTSVSSINDSGTMVGHGTKNGSEKAWLLESRE